MDKPVKQMIVRTATIAVVCSFATTSFYIYKGLEGVLIAAFIPVVVAIINSIFNLQIFNIIDLPMANFSKKYMINRFLKFAINLFVFLGIIFGVKQNNLTLILVYLVVYILFFIQEILELQVLTKKRKVK